MAKLVDATDLIGLSLGMETYQVKTFKFRETLELKMGNPEPNPIVRKQRKIQKARITQGQVQRLNGSCSNKWSWVDRVALVKESFRHNFRNAKVKG